MVKDELIREGSVEEDFIKEVKLSYNKYEAEQKKRKALLEAQQAERNKKQEDLTKQADRIKLWSHWMPGCKMYL